VQQNTPNFRSAIKAHYGIDTEKYKRSNEVLDFLREHLYHFMADPVPVESGGTVNTTLMHGDARYERS
jgi:hypothetical protein